MTTALRAQSIALADGGEVLNELIATINEHRALLSEIDGAIGDGDHGVNMSKGFTACGARLAASGRPPSLPEGFEQLAQALMDGIGGSMGPLYGSFFLAFAQALEAQRELDAPLFASALEAGIESVREIGNAQPGDKTLMDTLVPALTAYRAALAARAPFDECLRAMSAAAEEGKESTRALQAKIGRAARLGPRSVGVLDAGATSCCLILQSMARTLQRQLAARGNE